MNKLTIHYEMKSFTQYLSIVNISEVTYDEDLTDGQKISVAQAIAIHLLKDGLKALEDGDKKMVIDICCHAIRYGSLSRTEP